MIIQLIDKKMWFFVSWLFLLVITGSIAAIRNFDPGVCRHLAIAGVLFYFIFLFLSYRHSPLVVSENESWWKISTHKTFQLLISNPVKILLSVSLLALLVFIDIGFAIVFLNFLFFNEVFLCINYSISGLSAGSKRNAMIFGAAGFGYLLFFMFNLLYAPAGFQIFNEYVTANVCFCLCPFRDFLCMAGCPAFDATALSQEDCLWFGRRISTVLCRFFLLSKGKDFR